MKIGIFGDSYAVKFRMQNKAPAWHNFIEEKYNTVNHAEAGSSLYFSIEKFQQFHSQYDKVIFFVTSSHRYFLPEHSWFTDRGILMNNFTFAVANSFKTNPPETEKGKLIANLMMEYYSHIENDRYEHYIHRIMVDDVKRQRPDALFVDTVKDLFPIFEKETNYYGFTKDNINYINDYFDIRSCHLTNRNNKILADLIEHWIQTNEWKFDSNLFVDHDLPFEEYFIKL